ncbi:hypothetical protein KBY97_06100 [Synechococcus sp. ATX 2A4]|uniref:hypothetical protein n=1 Tax=Synechococcus sp. ATX 2A4 TaxID=2823727 RepID=UPI0020CCA99F|nr:hypothetical protein [Synechococcus sp. ATX 2A4]MCP9884697.1 hypothetical protein [Synechococcus sp. ATX 2A4]
MTQAGARRRPRRPARDSTPGARPPAPPPLPGWTLALVAGVTFGLGYGVTGRLLDLRPDAAARLGESFEVKPTPGTSLESLRMRFGAPSETIDDLGLLEQEQRRREEQEKREAAARAQPAPVDPNASTREEPVPEAPLLPAEPLPPSDSVILNSGPPPAGDPNGTTP